MLFYIHNFSCPFVESNADSTIPISEIFILNN